MGYTYAQRLDLVLQKREKLQQQLASLQKKKKMLTAREQAVERKELARKKYRLGGLVMLAAEKQNNELTDEVLLGGLLQIHSESHADKIQIWKSIGSALLKSQRHEVKESAAAQGFTQVAIEAENYVLPPQILPPRFG